MNSDEKIDKIFSIVSRMDKSMGILQEKQGNTQRQVDRHEGTISSIETAVEFFKIENAKLGVFGRAAGFIGGIAGSIIGGIIIGVVTYFILK